MKPYTKAELSAMRKRWAGRRAALLAKPSPAITLDEVHELHGRVIEESRHRVALLVEQANSRHRAAAEAIAAGGGGIAKTLRLLAANSELGAALEVASRHERERGHERGHERLRLCKRNRDNATRPRPRRRPPLLDVLLTTLGPSKRDGVTFRVLMRRWRQERIGTLRLDDLGGARFRVTDENGAADAWADYTRGTLAKHYSKSR